MSNCRGFTLVELLVVMMVAGVLLLVMGQNLQGRMTAYQIEGQVKELKADLLHTRERAMHRKHLYWLDLNSSGYQITEDTDDDLTKTATDTKLFATNKVFASAVTGGSGTYAINTRGLVETVGMITFDDTRSPDYNCLDLSWTRIEIGKTNGANCDVK